MEENNVVEMVKEYVDNKVCNYCGDVSYVMIDGRVLCEECYISLSQKPSE